MLSPSDFVARWGADEVTPFNAKAVGGLPISAEDKAFLLQAGLPCDAAPFLSFETTVGEELPTVAAQWGAGAELARYRVIGADGAGSPIALDDQSAGEVVLLDHDNQFARALMNSTVRQLAESLLAYRTLVQTTIAEFGADAFLDGKTSVAARNELSKELTRIDPAAVKPGSFWYGELQNLEANAG